MNIAQTGHNNCTCTRVEVERTRTTISVLVSDHHQQQQQQQLISERAQLPSESLLRRQQRQNENNNNNPNMNKSKNTSKGNGKNEHKHENENEKEQPVCQLSTTTPLPVSLLENIVTTNLVSPTVSPFPEVLPEDGDDTNIDDNDNDNDNTDDNNNDDDGPPKVPLPATATATATTATATATRTEDSEQEEEEEEELDSGSGSDSYLYLPLARCLEEAAEGNTEATKQLVIRYTNGTGGATRDIVRAFFAMETYLRSGSGDSNSNGDNNGNNNNNNNKRNCCVREPDTIRLFLYTSARLLLGSSTNSEFPEEQRRLPPGLRDARRGVRLLEIAARTYHCTASMRLLGTGLYLEGRHPNVPRDLERALHWLARGARCGDGLSAFRLAMAFHAGPITPVHQGLERKWLAISDALGCPLAGQALQVDAVRGRRMGRDEARRRLRHLGKEKNITDYLETDRTRECSNPGCDRVEPESASTSTSASASTSELEERFPLCERCKQVKYCSRECQVLHWRMHGGHREKCRELETGKEEMKRCNRNIALPFANICWYCYSYQPEPGAQFLACSSCMVARYCSRECQLLDYRDGHKKDCELVCTYLEEADRLLGELDARTTPSGTE